MSDYKQRILNRVNNVERLKHNQQHDEVSSRPGSWDLDNPVDISIVKNNNLNDFETIRQSRMSGFTPISKGAFDIVKENAVGESLSSLPSRKNNQIVNTPLQKPVELPIVKNSSYAFLFPEIVPKKRNNNAMSSRNHEKFVNADQPDPFLDSLNEQSIGLRTFKRKHLSIPRR